MNVKLLFSLSICTCLMASCGVDIVSREDVRDSLKACSDPRFNASGYLMCVASLREAQTISGPVTVLLTSGKVFQDELSRRKVSVDEFLDSALSVKYARAHIFAISNLNTGQFSTIDGVKHNITCKKSSSTCRVDDLIEGSSARFDVKYTGGNIYGMDGLLSF